MQKTSDFVLFFCSGYFNLTTFLGLSSYENILVNKVGAKKNVGFIQLNRPKALNSLCDALMLDVNDALQKFNNDDTVGCIVITGNEKAFAGEIVFQPVLV